MITSYTTLKTEVADFSKRDDLTSKMDTFCQLAEGMINRDLRCQEMEKRDAQSFDSTFYDLPTDYLELIALEIEYGSRRNPLRQVSPQILDKTYSTATGNPRAFTIQAGQIEFRPGIDASSPFTGELIYYASVPTLTSNSTNDVLDKWPMIYLSAMLIQVYIYLHDEEQTNVWLSAFNTQVRNANRTTGKYVLPKVSTV